VGYVTSMTTGEIRSVLWWEWLRERVHYEDLGVQGRTAVVWMLHE